MIRLTSVCSLLFISLYLFAQSPKLMIPVGHTDGVTHVVFSPDGKRIATGSKDKTIKLWDTNTGLLLANLKGHSGEITSLYFNAMGDRLISTASLDTNALLWNVSNGSLITALHSSSYIKMAVFNAQGTQVFITTSGEQPVLYDTHTGMPKLKLATWDRYISEAAFSPDGKKLVSNNGEVWSTESGALLFKLKGGKFQSIHFNPNGRQIITSNYEKTIEVWDTTGILVHQLKGHTEYLKSFWFAPDGSRLVTATGHTTFAKLWDLDKGILLADLKGNDYYLTSVSFSADGKHVITTGNSNGMILWDAVTGKQETKITGGNSKFARFHEKENSYILQHNDEAFVANIASGNKLAVLQGTKGLSQIAFHPRETKLAGVGDNPNTVTVWDSRNGRIIKELKGFTGEISSAESSSSGDHLITRTHNAVNIWSIGNGMLAPSKASLNDSVVMARYSPDGKILVALRDKNNTYSVGIWDAASLNPVNTNLQARGMQQVAINDVHSYIFSTDSKKLFLSNKDWGSYIVDGQNGSLMKSISHDRLWHTAINPSATVFGAYGPDGVEIKNIEASAVLTKFPASVNGFEPLIFTGYKDRFLLFDIGLVSLYEANGSKPIITFPNGLYRLNKEKDKILIQTLDTIRIWDLVKAKQEFQFIKPKDSIYYTAFWDVIWASDEQSIIYSLNKKEIKKVDLKGHTIVANAPYYAKSFILSDDKSLLFCIADEEITVLNSYDLKYIATLKGHDNPVVTVMRMTDTTKLLTVAKDNTARVWELGTGKLIYTYLLLDKEYNLSLLPSGYYKSNQSASKLLYYVDTNLRPISFEQLDVKYNRPDLVLQALKHPDTALIHAYHKAYEKRIRRLNIDTTTFSNDYAVPVAEFVDRGSITYEQKEGKLALHIQAKDSLYPLDRFNLWINESPLFGSRGLSLKGRKQNAFDTTITITLSQGTNKIETSVANSNGIESYRMPLTVSHTSSQPGKSKLYFIGIGIDRFKETGHDLQYSAADIRGLAVHLKEKYGNEISIDTLFDSQVNLAAVAALKKRLLSTLVDDKIIIAYSGHGLLSKSYDYYLSAYGVNFKDPQQGGIPYDALESLLDGIPARNKLMLIDACHSGEVDKEEMEKLKKGTAALKEKGTTAKGVEDDELTGTTLGMKNSFELMQELFVNVGKSTGATVISAAAGTQFAQERDELKNGVFTYAILELMKSKNEVTVTELKNYVNRRVTDLTNGLQVPTTRSEIKSTDWKVW